MKDRGALIEVSYSLQQLLVNRDQGLMPPSLDVVANCIRSVLLKNPTEFKDLTLVTFIKRFHNKRKALSLYRRFMRENKARIAELLLTVVAP